VDDFRPNIDERIRALALALTGRIGWKLIHRLLDHFGSFEAILVAPEQQLRKVPGIGPQIAASIGAIDLARLVAALDHFRESGITVATWQDPVYPPQLNALDDRPLVLFWKGTLRPDDCNGIAIVGTREPSEISIRLAHQWAADLAARSCTVVSGLAHGIDTAAHRGALAAGGRTLAVLGCGINTIYPPQNAPLAEEIIRNGALICEVQPDTAPSTSALMRRNRLIAALSIAAIVVEAGDSSGALHAARFAHALGRPVFAIDNSAGNRALLRDFAHPLPESFESVDILLRTASQ
jgi:DNA processing protein